MDCKESNEYANLCYDLYDGSDDDMMVAMLTPIVIFHGLFDHKGNWVDIAKSVADKSVRKVYVLDMRNHGDSPRMANMTHDANVKDLEMFLKKINEPVILIGHSLGGTAVMEIAFKKPHLVKQLILIDVSPLRYPSNEEVEVKYLISQIRSLLDFLNSTEKFYELNLAMEKYFQEYIKNITLCKMILSNVKKDNNEFTLMVNLDPIEIDLCQKKKMREVYPLQGSYQGKTLLIHGNSDYVSSCDYNRMKKQFSNLSITRMKNCGHWIHMEEPNELVESIVQFLSKSS